MASRRFERLNEEFLREIADIIRHMKDPRIGDGVVSVVRVEVTNDLAHAKVYVSVFGDEKAKQNAYEALKSAAGFIRTELSTRLDIRRVPQLNFIEDESMEYAARMSKMIDEVISKDEKS